MKKCAAITLVILLSFLVGTSSAVEVTRFGPKQYLRTGGAPDVYNDSFSGKPGEGRLIVQNGEQDGSHKIDYAISSAYVHLNGVEVFGPNDFNKNVHYLEAPVDLTESNSLSIQLQSSPNSYITVSVLQEAVPPTVSMEALPETINFGESATLTWSSGGDTESASIDQAVGPVAVDGLVEVTPTETTTYTITVTGPAGTATDSATVTVINPPPTVNITANPESILYGESAALTWSSTNADSVSIDQGMGNVPLEASIRISPTETTTYSITAIGPGGTATDTTTVTVTHPAPTVIISADPVSIAYGSSATLSWSSTHASSASLDQGIGNVPANGSTSVAPTETTAYTITATGPGGTATASAEIAVIRPSTVSLSASPGTIIYGSSSTLSWISTYADSVVIDPGIGSVSLEGTQSVTPNRTTTYTITATGPDGTASAQVAITVEADVEPQPEASMGEEYEDLIPPDATVGSYDPKRFSMLTGLVQDPTDVPVSDVSVTILGHSEYGTAFTDSEGRFSIPVEGGDTLTTVYQKEGLITVQRKVHVGWNDIAVADTIQMIAEDPASTTVTFDGNPGTVITHESTEVSDGFGSRSFTMIFAGDNRAYEVDSQGDVIQELSTITTRATEFTTPESMPAKLPPTSAYTYCADLTVDGVQRVRFEKPVVTWVENFLGFAVGEIVPVGYYDRDRGVWVPSENGVVVSLLDTNADGSVDALDANGNGEADDLNSDGFFNDEVMGLSDSQKYAPGSTFWRVEVTHFTPYDYNWPVSPPSDAIFPNPQGGAIVDQQRSEERDCKSYNSSHVEERSRIVHEDIPIPGTDMTLHYASNRVEGYRHRIVIPASGETVPSSLKGIVVRLDVAGRSFVKKLPAGPNQKAEFIWDGLDYRSRPVSGTTAARVNIGFVYGMFYSTMECRDFEVVFGLYGCGTTGILAREEQPLWRNSDLVIRQVMKGTSTIAEGWTLSAHHTLSPNYSSTLHKGDGTIIENDLRIITTVAGSGGTGFNGGGYSGDGGPATEARFHRTSDVAVDAQGNLYIADSYNHRIRKVDTNGIVTTMAGNGTSGYSGDGGPATEAQLNYPGDVTVDAQGNLYIADVSSHCVRIVENSGIISTVAGSCCLAYNCGGYSGDGGLATEAQFRFPKGIAVDALGNLYIADSGNDRIRKVDANGIITTVVGNGNEGFSGDEGLATEASLNSPWDVDLDSLGNLYISDRGNRRIRKVDTSGIITTVAGNGNSAYSGDEGLATEASFSPSGVTVDAQGNLYIADSIRIRIVDATGIITTLAGRYCNDYFGDCFSGDGGPPSQAQLFYPADVAVDALGDLYIADRENNRIRKVAMPGAAFTGLVSGTDIPFAEEGGLGYVLTSTGRHKKTISLDTGVTLYEFGYDDDNNLISIADRFGNRAVIERNGANVPTAIISPNGIKTTLAIDDNNQLTRITYPDASYYSFEYTPDGLLTAKIEPERNRYEHLFDTIGRLTDVTDQHGGSWHYTSVLDENDDIRTEILTGEGNLTTYLDHTESTGAYTSYITDPTGAQSVFSRSADGLVETKSLACGMNLSFKYGLDTQYKFQYIKELTQLTPSGLERVTSREKTYEDTDSNEVPDLITETVTINGKTSTLATDTIQATKTVTSPEGRLVTTLYDPVTLQPKSWTISGLHDSTYEYDTRAQLTSIQTDTRETTFSYNDQGLLASVTDPADHTTSYTYDAVGRRIGIGRPGGSSVGFTYDKNGNMTVITNPVSISHNFDHNAVNLKTSYLTPLGGSYSYVYDKDRRLIQVNFPSEKLIDNVYANGRLEQIQTPEGNIDFTYLCGSKVGTVTKGLEGIAYGYDGSLVTSETMSGTLDESLDYTYNSDFTVSSFTYAGGSSNYGYDNDGLLTSAGSFTISRNAGNGLPDAVTGSGLNLTRTFNGYGEVESEDFAVDGQVRTSLGLTRGGSGRITSRTETVSGTTYNYIYTYDSMGRLLTVTKDGTLVEEYQYDSVGTRIYEINALRGISGRTTTYDEEDRLLTVGTAMYQYDPDGYLSSETAGADVTSYTYSSRGELLSVTLPDGRVIEYAHDPLARRIAKKVNGTVTEKYLWQGLTRLLAVYDGSDNLLMRFQYADGRMPAVMTKGAGTYYLSYDQVGSLRHVADASGTLVKSIEYDSFGNVINDTDPSFAVPIGFAGGLQDSDTGLIRFGSRDYDPDTGRWTAKDPIFFEAGDTDLYGYCLNNPVSFVDPDGNIQQLVSGYENVPIIFGSRVVTRDYVEGIQGRKENLRSKKVPTVTGSVPRGTRSPARGRDSIRSVSGPCQVVTLRRYGPVLLAEGQVISAGYGPVSLPIGPVNPGPINPGNLLGDGLATPPWSFTPESSSGGGTGTAGAVLTVRNVAVNNINTSSATITWTTDQPADSVVEYGITDSYGSSAAGSELDQSHNITLTGLSLGTTYHLSVKSANDHGFFDASEDYTFTTLSSEPHITISITSPTAGESIPRPDVMVKGTVTNALGNETGVTVNGVIAMVYGTEFVANHAPLEEGQNTITAVATDIEGYAVEALVTVDMVPEATYITLTANTYSGLSPFETTLSVEASFDLTELTLTHSGPGQVEILNQPTETEYELRTTGEGIYYFTAEGQDSQNNTYVDTIALVVLDRAQLTALLKSKWDEMTAALMAGDVETGLDFFAAESRDGYRETFSNLGSSKINSIFSNVTDIELNTVDERVAGCGAIRIETGGTYSYPVIFIKDENGIWKIMGL